MKRHCLKIVYIFYFVALLFFTSVNPLYAQIYDDFNGSSIDTNKWYIVQDNNNSANVFNQSSGSLEIKSPPIATRGHIISNASIRGDFDIIADWSRFNYQGTVIRNSYAGVPSILMQINQGNGPDVNMAWVGRLKNEETSNDSEMYYAGTGIPNQVNQHWISENDTSGKFRITRTGTEVTSSYWNNGWQTLADDQNWGSGDVRVMLGGYTGDNPNATFHAQFDQIEVLKGTIVLPKPEPPRTYGLFLGVKDDGYFGTVILGGLEGGLDANAVFNKFEKLPGWSQGNVLYGDMDKVDGDISIDSIRSEINKLNMKSGDNFILYASSHGGSTNSGSETTNNPGDEYLQLGPYTTLTDNQLLEELSKITQGVNKLIILDSCSSGGFWGNNANSDYGDLEKLGNTALIAAALEDGYAWTEYSITNLQGRGYFSLVLADALSLIDGHAAADLDGNGLDFSELSAWMQDKSKWNIFVGTYAYPKDPGLGDPTLFSEDMVGGIAFRTDDYKGTLGATVPEPATLLLFGLGLLGLSGVRRKLKK